MHICESFRFCPKEGRPPLYIRKCIAKTWDERSGSLKQHKIVFHFFLGVRTRGGNSNQNLEKSRAVYLTPLSSPLPRSSRVLKTSDIHKFFRRIFREYFTVWGRTFLLRR